VGNQSSGRKDLHQKIGQGFEAQSAARIIGMSLGQIQGDLIAISDLFRGVRALDCWQALIDTVAKKYPAKGDGRDCGDA
jgi:hypothetical protein